MSLRHVFALRPSAPCASEGAAPGLLLLSRAWLLLATLLVGVAPAAHAQRVAALSAADIAGIEALGGNGLVFDGVDDRVEVPHNGRHVFTNTVTLEGWVRPDGAFVQFAGIVTKGVSGGTPWSFHLVGDGRLQLQVNNAVTGGSAQADYFSTSALTLGAWQHVAVVVGGGAVRFYINGTAAGETAGTVTFAPNTQALVIGAELPGAPEYWRGAIDEVRIWNTARTAQQIRDSRDRVLSASSTGLVGYWDFETLANLSVGAAGVNDVADKSVSAAHGDVIGGATLAPAAFAPPAVRATYDLYEDRVVLAWNVSGASTARYQVRRDGLLLATLSATDTTYTDRAGIAARTYPYCVTRQDGAAFTELGCDDGRRQLLAANSVSATDGTHTDRVRITWTDRSAINTGYKVYRAGTLVATLGDVGTYDDVETAALTPGTAYSFCVAPIQGAGEGPQVCDPGSRGSVLPAANVVATDGTVPGATRITWSAPVGGDPTTGNPAGAFYAITRDGRALMEGLGEFSFLDTGGDVPPVAGTTYTYCVTRTVPGGGSSVAVCDAGGFGTLPVLTNVTASDSTRDDRVDVRWAGGGGAADGVRITRQGGGGVVFDGVNDGIEVPSFTLSPPVVTVEAWIKPTGGFVDGASIVTKGRTATPWSLLTTGDGRLRVASNFNTTGGTAAINILSTGTLALDVWQHVAVTISGTTVRFYINGVLAGESSQAMTFGANTEPLYIGADLVGAVAYFRGSIDEVRVWSTIRTQAELRAGMHAPATGAEDGLAVLYHLDDGVGTRATDARGGKHGVLLGFDGTATSGWQAAGAPVASHGQSNALRLDGTDDYAVVNGLTSLPASFTIEFWARRAATGRDDFAIGQGVGTSQNGLNIGFRGNNRFIVSFVNNDLDTPQAFTDLDWNHWAVTYDRATGRRTIVRNGAEVASDVSSGPYSGSGSLRIGQSTANGLNGYFGGDIDDVRIWSRVRPAAAIAANRFALADSARAGLVAAWSFDALDASGTAAMTTTTGQTTTGATTVATLTNGATLVPGRPAHLALLPAGATAFADATAEPGMLYRYCVASYANAGAATADACDTGLRARAVAPAVIVASDGTFENKVTIAWQGVSTRAATYNVYRTGTLVATLPATRTSYDDAGGAPTTVYTYCVAAFTADGVESTRVCDPGHRILRPTTPTASDDAQEDRVELTWADNSGAETGYRITRAPETNHALTIGTSGSIGTYIQGAPTLVGATDFTIEFWVKPTTLAGDRKLIVLGAYTSDRTVAPQFVNGTFMIGFIDNRLYPEVWDSQGRQSFSSGTVPNGVWSHIAVTYKSGSALIGYVNGVEVGRDASVGTYTPWYDQIGFGGFGTPVSGDVDDLRFWKTARTAAQIVASKDQLIPAGATGLSGVWSFDEGVGNLASDGGGVVVNGVANPIVVGPGASWTTRTASLPAPAVIAETAAGATAYTDRTGASSVRYTYGVTPFDALGAGTTGTDAGRRVMKAPSGLTVTSPPNEKTISLAWTDNSQVEGIQNVIRTGGGTTTRFRVARNAVSLTDPSPVIGTDYTYHLASENVYGVSVPSDAVTAKTILLPPASVSASDTYADKVVVTWVDVSGIETGYNVYRNGTQLGSTLAAGTTTYTDATAVAGTTYTYSVRTVSGSATSEAGSDTGVRPVTTVTTIAGAFSGTLSPSPPVYSEKFGENVAVWGDWAAVSNTQDNMRGTVYIYRRQNGAWTQSQKLVASDLVAGDVFGNAVAMDGGDLFVGSYLNDGAGFDTGAIYVFRLNGTTWSQVQKITGPTVTQSWFGWSVAVDGDYAAVGSLRESQKGSVRIFRRENGAWQAQQTLVASDGINNDQFGRAVSLSGARLLVGTLASSPSAYVFTRSGTTWTQRQKLLPAGASTPGTDFGFAVAISGDHAIIGAPGDGTTGMLSGAAYLYRWNGSTYASERKVFASDAAQYQNFGRSVAMRGAHALVGATSANAAYLLRYENDTWTQQRKITSPTSPLSSNIGWTAAASDEGLVAGALVSSSPTVASAAFFVEVAAPVASTTASDGTYAARVQVRWGDVAPNTENVRIYRDGQKIGETPPDARNFDDFDAPPGDLSRYCVATYRQAYGESPQVCDLGWRPADGAIAGRVATFADGQLLAGVPDVNVCLAPPPNNALLVDGTGGYVRAPGLALGTAPQLTIEAWVRPTGTSFVQYGSIATQGVTTSPWSLYTNSNGTLGLLVNQGLTGGSTQASFTSTRKALTLNQWQHAAVTVGTDSVRFYIDGAYAGGASAAITFGTNSESLIIGAEIPGVAEYFRGGLDEVRIWKRRRTQAEIQATMRTALTGKETDLAAYLPFDQGATAYALDMTSAGGHGAFTGGASWTDQASPLQSCAISDATGSFSLTGLRYGSGQSFQVEASLDGHVFQPAVQTVRLSAQSPIQNQVSITDASAHTVAGKVRYNTTSPRTGLSYGTCGVPGVAVSATGVPGITTDDQGDFRLALSPGSRTISFQKNGLTFSTESVTLDLTGAVTLPDNIAGPNRRLIVRTETAGGFAIGTHTLRIRSEDGCYDRTATTDANGNVIDDLPPLKYTVQVTGTVLKTGTGLDQIDVDRYFTGLGAQLVDLTEKSDTLAMAYRAPLRIAVTGFPAATGTGAQTCAAPDKLGLPTLAQGLFYPLLYSVTEDFGALGSFPVQDVRIQIVDEIADETETPIDTTLAVGTIAYQTSVGQPNVLSGRVVDGVDRSYQKSIQITATAGARTATRTDWAVVTGQKARNGSFVSFTTEEVPLYVLRDPPGDASYSYIEKGSTYCFTLADWSTSNSLGMVSNFQNMLGVHNLLLTAPLGIGTAVAFQSGIGMQGGTNVQMTWRREGGTQLCMEAKERFSTSADPEYVGADADVFIGAAFNMLFAQTDKIAVNAATCTIEPSTGYGMAPDPTNPVKSTYAYTTKHIRDVVIPQIEALKAAATPTDTTRYSTYLANWRNHLTYNAALKTPAAATSGASAEQRAFSGGADFAASFTTDTTYHHTWSTHMYNESGLGVHQALKVPALEFSAGWQLKFTRETTFELPGFIGAPPMNGHRSLSERRTTGYVLSDRNTGDSYAVNVRPEAASEVKVFIPAASTDAAAAGYGAVGGVLSAVGGGLKVVSVYGNLVSYYTASGAYNGSIFGSIVGTGINMAFGLAQGLYDFSSILDPETVTSAAIQTKLRQPFGSPVFDLVAGTSSCPWLPDPTFSAAGGTQRGTLRRDLPTLSIGRTSLVNADPSKPAVFSLFLGNASESNETRRYVLRSINERNPNGAVMRVNGTPIHEGVVFSLAPGKQIEATLSVERGPTRFRYDSLQVILYPECAGLPASISEKEGAVQTFSVSFKSVSSPVVLYTSPRFDFDFGAIAEAALGDSIALADFTLETIDYGDLSTASDDVYLTEIGMEYRAATSAVWMPAFAATRAQIIAASAQGAAATTYYTRWKPASSDVDGVYQFRPYTRSTGGGPAGAIYYGDVVSGRIDRKAPLVFGSPQPSDEVLSLGDDVVLTFDEAVAPASVLADSSVTALASANLRLVYADGAESGQRIRVRAVVSGASVVVTPVAGWAALEGRRLTAELRVGSGVKPLTDVLGNALVAGQTWTFVVRRSAVAWSVSDVALATSRGIAPRVTVNLANGRPEALTFTLDGVPAWLTPSVLSGTISPGVIQPIAFVASDTLASGTHTAAFRATTPSGDLPITVTVTVRNEATPSWSVTPSQFQHSMAVTAQLFLRGRPSVDANDIVGAFVGGELRGVAHVTPRTSSGQTSPDSNRVSLVIYSNATSGEVVTFKVWDADASAPVLYTNTSRSLAFAADAIEGTPTRPLSINAPFVPGAASLALNAGWTWVSFPRVPESATLASVLSPFFGLSATGGDVVKSQRSFAMFSGSGSGGAWMGPLADSMADVRQSYMVRLSSSQELMMSFGGAVADTMGSIPLSAGWNWIGFPRSVSQALSHALAVTSFGVAPSSNDLIKSQTGFAQYVPGLGWVGSLTMLEPGRGYMMKRSSASTLSYPAAAPSVAAQGPDVATSEIPISDAALSSSGAGSTMPSWSVDPQAYQFNMTAIVALEDASVGSGALVGAFSGDSLRGVATLRTVQGSTRPLAFLMVYGNRASGEALSFRVYDPVSGQTTTLASTQAFTSDAMLGTVAAPLVLQTGRTTDIETLAPPTVFEVLPPAPNPFAERTTLRYALPSTEHVTVEVFDVTGRRVARLFDGQQAPGRYAVPVDGAGWASGVYLVHVRAGRYQQTVRLLHLP